MTKTICIRDNTFILHPSGSAFWQERNVLLISDVHLGKVSHFRKYGVAIPENSILRNFERLNEVLEFFAPQKLVFLGDLFHSKKNQEWELFATWLQYIQTEIILIAGNHDIIEQKHYDELKVRVTKEIIAGGFLFTHHPQERQGVFNFCGHIHPAVQLYGMGKQFMKLPCFFKKENQMILPAFGEFTGTFVLRPEEKDCVYAIAKDQIVTVCGD
jgi:uncharacterized protein